MTRQGVGFSGEISTLARKLTALTQELRLGIVSFQLDTPENASNTVLSSSGSVNKQPANYNLSAGGVTPQQNMPVPSWRLMNSRPLS